MANNNYKLCPKCELNWITEDLEICEVCKQLTKGEIDIYDDIEEEELMLCPICNMNFILETEAMCENCALERAGVPEEVEEEYNFAEDVIIPEEDDDILVSFDEIEEEEEKLAIDEDIYDDIDEDEQDF